MAPDHYIPDPKFSLATPEETEKAREHTHSVRESVEAWSCNHCHDFFEKDKAETLPVILGHLKEKYDIYALRLQTNAKMSSFSFSA